MHPHREGFIERSRTSQLRACIDGAGFGSLLSANTIGRPLPIHRQVLCYYYLVQVSTRFVLACLYEHLVRTFTCQAHAANPWLLMDITSGSKPGHPYCQSMSKRPPSTPSLTSSHKQTAFLLMILLNPYKRGIEHQACESALGASPEFAAVDMEGRREAWSSTFELYACTSSMQLQHETVPSRPCLGRETLPSFAPLSSPASNVLSSLCILTRSQSCQ
ncbi:hypothetical protein J3F83DRAFT_270981 [Trichoderma novae-zelandiae]